jgi:hypothetical protein
MTKAMKRIHPAPEPMLKVHNYIVTIYLPNGSQKIRYCTNRQEVRDLKKKGWPKSSQIHVFKAAHNFTEGWLA